MAGNYRSGGHSRAGRTPTKAECKDRITDTEPPEDLGAGAAKYWRYYAPILVTRDLWTASARDTLRVYAEALAVRDRLTVELNTAASWTLETVTVDGSGQEHSTLKAHPLLTQLRAVRLECRQHANDLCLSPAAALRTPTGVPEAGAKTKWETLTARPRLVSKKA